MNLKPSVEPYAVLEMFRRTYKKLPAWVRKDTPSRAGFVYAVSLYLHRLEDCTPEAELWSIPGLPEDKLLPHMRIGEHIAITRRIMGITP